MTKKTTPNALQGLNLNYATKSAPAPALNTKNFALLVKEAANNEFAGEFTVNAAIAKHLLEKHNPKNRKIHAPSVTALARDMREGRWLGHVGDEITFDNKGHLNNGQHRLAAIVESGLEQRMSLRFGLNEAGRLVEGRGRTKQFSDYLSMTGGEYKHQAALSALVRLLYGFLLDNKRPQSASGNAKPTNGELNEVMVEFGESLYESLVYMKSLNILHVMVDTNAALLHFLFKQTTHGKAKADDFFAKLANGAAMNGTDPRLVVRNRFIADTTKMYRQQGNKDITMGLVAKAWNAWVHGKDWSSKERTPAHLVQIDGLTKLGDRDIYAAPKAAVTP